MGEEFVFDRKMGIEGQWSATVPEESATQFLGLGLLAKRLVARRVADDAGQPRGARAIGAVELPGGGHGPIDQVLLDVIPWLEVGRPGVDAHLERLGILAGQDEGLGGSSRA